MFHLVLTTIVSAHTNSPTSTKFVNCRTSESLLPPHCEFAGGDDDDICYEFSMEMRWVL